MDSDDDEHSFGSTFPPALVSLTHFAASVSPSPRRLSSCFTQPSEPVRAKRQLAWVSLQGRLVGAEEATSAKTIDRNGLFSAKEAVGWELFTPIQCVLVVAVVAAVAANSTKNRQIVKLRKSVELRDQVLLCMQQKLDNICEQMSYFKDQSEVVTQSNGLVTKRVECRCNLYQHDKLLLNGSLINTPTEGLNGDEVFEYNTPLPNEVEQEERRMSDLSDWAPSIASSVDIQLDGLALEHDINSLRKECEQKDVTIKELSAFLQSSEVLGSKRISELEDIIRRKNTIVNKLRKDIITLEQKVVNLTRLRRPSFSKACSSEERLPLMADNVLYDMDSTTGPSSSESDSSPRKRPQALASNQHEVSSVQICERASNGDLKLGHVKSSTYTEQNLNSQTKRPLIENSLIQSSSSVPALRPKHTSDARLENKSRRQPPAKSKEVSAYKRWV